MTAPLDGETHGWSDMDQLAAEVIAAVERLLREGKAGRVDVDVNTRMQRVILTRPDDVPLVFRLDRAA